MFHHAHMPHVVLENAVELMFEEFQTSMDYTSMDVGAIVGALPFSSYIIIRATNSEVFGKKEKQKHSTKDGGMWNQRTLSPRRSGRRVAAEENLAEHSLGFRDVGRLRLKRNENTDLLFTGISFHHLLTVGTFSGHFQLPS